MTSSHTRKALISIVAAGLCLAFFSSASAKPSNKWRISVSEGAKSDGTIMFNVAPIGGTAIDIEVKVADHTSENDVAKVIEAAFKAKLPEASFGVEVDDGEDVLVKAKSGTPEFDLRMNSSTVKAVRINLKRE